MLRSALGRGWVEQQLDQPLGPLEMPGDQPVAPAGVTQPLGGLPHRDLGLIPQPLA